MGVTVMRLRKESWNMKKRFEGRSRSGMDCRAGRDRRAADTGWGVVDVDVDGDVDRVVVEEGCMVG